MEDVENLNNEKKEKTPIINQEKMMEILDWSYNKVIEGMPGQKNIYELVDDYLSKHDKETAINNLIRFQISKAGTSGFVTGFGGLVTMPITLPANITSVILVQLRMIAAIALIRGYNLKDDQVQSFIYTTLAGTTVSEIAKKGGIVVGQKAFVGVVKKIPGSVLVRINQRVGFRLVTKFGTKGAVNLGKMVPVAGAVIGGSYDGISTNIISKLAKRTFTECGINLGDGTIIDIKSDIIEDIEI